MCTTHKPIIITKYITFDEATIRITYLKEKVSMRTLDNTIIPLVFKSQHDEPTIAPKLDGRTFH